MQFGIFTFILSEIFDTWKKTNNENEIKMSQLFFPVSSSIFLFSLQLKEMEIFAAAGMLTSFDKIKMF